MGEEKDNRSEITGGRTENGAPSPPASAENVLAPPEEETSGTGAPDGREGAAGGAGEKTGSEDVLTALEKKVAELSTRLAEADARAQEYWNRLVRLQADFENFRKRAMREKEELFNFAGEELIKKLLPVLDNFELALASGRENPEDQKGFYAGVEMIYRQLKDLLFAEGLAPVPALREEFDPGRHEAVGWEETGEKGMDNIILKELRKGYFLKDKVIRPAMVVVARSKPEDEVLGG